MFLTVVGCFDVQNVAFTNQSGEDTNQIGRFEVLDVILHRHYYGQVRGRTAKWMLAFTKFACMIWGISLLLHKFYLHSAIEKQAFIALVCMNFRSGL